MSVEFAPLKREWDSSVLIAVAPHGVDWRNLGEVLSIIPCGHWALLRTYQVPGSGPHAEGSTKMNESPSVSWGHNKTEAQSSGKASKRSTTTVKVSLQYVLEPKVGSQESRSFGKRRRSSHLWWSVKTSRKRMKNSDEVQKEREGTQQKWHM